MAFCFKKRISLIIIYYKTVVDICKWKYKYTAVQKYVQLYIPAISFGVTAVLQVEVKLPIFDSEKIGNH